MERRVRLRSNAFIVGFLALQLVAPLGYYLGERGTDERFSWRMFSTVRMQRCRVDLDAVSTAAGEPGTRALNPQRDVQVAWINMLKRYRPAVVEKYLARSCEQEQAERVRYRRTCVASDGHALPIAEVTRTCETGETVAREVER